MRLTILFNDPYWIGLLEVERDGSLYTAIHSFGAEPGDPELYGFVVHHLALLQARMTVGSPTVVHSHDIYNNFTQSP